MEDRLILDYGSICDDIDTVLDSIKVIRSDRFFNPAMGDKADKKIRDYEVAVNKRLKDTFSLVVIGDFKRGKSTLINALLGENLLPTAVTPETVTINKLTYSETPKAEAVLKNGRRAMLKLDELKRDNLTEIIKQLPAEIDYVDICTKNQFLEDISIIDTPGIGDLMKAFDERVSSYLVNADALVYVISARSPLSLTEQAFLSSVIMPQSFSRMFLIVNMADTLETKENVDKIHSLTEERANAISDKIYVYTLSALDEYCRKLGKNRPEQDLEDYLEESFNAFAAALEDDVISQKEIIKSMRAVELTKLMLEDIEAKISLVKNALNTDVEKLSKNEEVYRKQNDDLLASVEKHKISVTNNITEMAAQAREWIKDFMTRLKAELETISARHNTEDIEKHFQFYMMDMMKNAILSCVECHHKDINDLLMKETELLASEVSTAAFGTVNVKIADCIKGISWTNTDTTMFAVNMVLGLTGLSSQLGLLAVVGDAIAGVVRKQSIDNKKQDYIAPTLENYHELIGTTLENLDSVYAQLKKSAAGTLDELYYQQVEASEEAITQAKQITADESIRVEEIEKYLGNVLEKVAENKAILEKYTV